MLVANGWLGEGSTVMANAERVKGTAEAYRYGSLLGCDLEEVTDSVEARWHDGCCRLDRSVQHPRAGLGRSS
jgi:hypothetical protein